MATTLVAHLQAAAAPACAAPEPCSTSLLAALSRRTLADGARSAAVAVPSLGRSPPRPASTVGGGAGVLAGAFDLVDSLRDDASPYALRPTDPAAFDTLVAAFADAVARSGAESTNQQDARYYDGYWSRFCAEQNTSRLRNDVAANTGADPRGFQREAFIQALFVVYVYTHMKPKRHGAPAPKPQSAVNVLSAVRRWHDKRGFRMAPLERVKRVLDGLTRHFVEKYGHEPLLPSRKEPYSHAVVAALFAVPAGSLVGGRALDWDDPVFRAWRFGLALTRHAGFRKGEICPAQRSRADLSRASLCFRLDGVVLTAPSTAQLLALRAGRDAVGVKPPRAKNDQSGLLFGNHLIWMPLEDAHTNAARCAVDAELRAPVAAEARAETPLLVGTPTGCAAMTPRQFDAILHDLLVLGVGPERAKCYSAHSGRIERACRLLAAGASRAQIQALCRWRGEAALDIYARLNASDYESWTRRGDLADLDSVQVASLPVIDDDDSVAAGAAIAHELGAQADAAAATAAASNT